MRCIGIYIRSGGAERRNVGNDHRALAAAFLNLDQADNVLE